MKPELSKHTLLLFKGDYELLRERYPETGAAVVVRNIIRNHLAQFETPVDMSKLKIKVDTNV